MVGCMHACMHGRAARRRAGSAAPCTHAPTSSSRLLSLSPSRRSGSSASGSAAGAAATSSMSVRNAMSTCSHDRSAAQRLHTDL